jgi:hypothetical protein
MELGVDLVVNLRCRHHLHVEVVVILFKKKEGVRRLEWAALEGRDGEEVKVRIVLEQHHDDLVVVEEECQVYLN